MMESAVPLPMTVEETSSGKGLAGLILKKPMLLLCGVTLGSWVLPFLTPLVYIGAAVHALRGPRQTIESFTVLSLVLLGTPLFFSGGDKSLRYLVFFAGFLGTIRGRPAIHAAVMDVFKSVRRVLWTFFFLLLLMSLLASKLPAISVLKVVSFALVAVTIILSFDRTRDSKDYWRAWFLNYFIFLFGASLVVNLAGMGYVRTPEGAQGIFTHPQTAGLMLSIITSWLGGRALMKSESPLLFLVSLAGLMLIWMTSSRTSLFSAVLGFAAAFFFFMLKRRSLADYRVPSKGKLVAMVMAGLLVVSQSSLLSGAITEFIEKGKETTDVTDTLTLSRGQLMQLSITNFLEHPLMGIGFGVPSTYEIIKPQKGSTVMGIPVSFSVEKGFMPTAILEETGIIGALMVIILLMTMARPIIRYGGFAAVWMFFSALMVNLGEAVFYSMGGGGFFVWLALGFCLNQSHQLPEDAPAQPEPDETPPPIPGDDPDPGPGQDPGPSATS